MNTPNPKDTHKAVSKDTSKTLYGPSVQFADGKLVAGAPLEVDHILAEFERLRPDGRSAFLCIFAHDLTVAVRTMLFDRPVSEADLDRVNKINEFLHQLTSCVNPHHRWSARDETLLLRAIIESSFERGLDRWVGHAFALAAGNTINPKESVASK
jgi:hypothetical protein